MSSNLHMILQDYLDEPKEGVVLNGQVFSWAKAKVEVPLVQSLVQCFFICTIWTTFRPYLKWEWGLEKIAKKGWDFL